MATTLKVLGQTTGAQTATSLYTVPAGTQTAVSTISVCNLSGSSNTYFSIAIRPDGATLANSMYIAYNTPLSVSDSIALTMGITLGTGDIITVYSITGNVAFSAFGSELA